LIQSSVRWDDAALAVAREVLAKGLHPVRARAEIAARLGAAEVSASSLRNAFQRRGLPFTYTGEAATSQPPRPSDRDTASGPATQPSVRGEYVEALAAGEEQAATPAQRDGVERILIIPDCHFPFIDRQAWNTMLLAARAFKPDTIAQLGDLIDCYSVSAHDKNPARKEKLVDEIEVTNAALDELDALGASRKIANEGNHSARVAKLVAKVPGLHGMFTLRERLGFDRRGWEFYPYRKTARIGALALVHDVGEAGKFAAMRARDAYEGDVVIGHVHQMSVTYSGSAKQDMHVGACLGWLGAPVAAEDYMPDQKIKRHWQTGFGVGYRDRKTDRVVIVPVPIFGGRCILEGVVYEAPRVMAEAA
jgi:hypothetical protein